MTTASGKRSLPSAILASLILTALSFGVLNRFLRAQIIPCTDTWAENLTLGLLPALALQIFLAPKIRLKHSKAFLSIHGLLILLTLWLGLYPISPLGYSSGRIPNLRGFLIVRASRTSTIANGEIVSLMQGSAVGISPLMLPGEHDCSWMSNAGGELDDPEGCDTVYIPPSADYDILQLRIRSSCGLPDAIGRIKVSILP